MNRLDEQNMRRINRCYDIRSLVLTLLYTVPQYVEAPIEKKNAIYDMVVRSVNEMKGVER